MVAYIGNGAYCYANTGAMLLDSIGEAVSPALVEVLTGVGLGASWNPASRLAFFDSVAPDVGLGRALDLLGFDVEERAECDDERPPFDALRAALADGPVALGPLDMGELGYIPWASEARGSDHFVLAFALAGDELRLHDPAGYPHAALPLAELEPAWRAASIPYRRGAFRRWFAPRRREAVAPAALFERALASFAATAAAVAVGPGEGGEPGGGGEPRGGGEPDGGGEPRGGGKPGGRRRGPPAIRAFAADLRAAPPVPAQVGHMTHFLFQLAVRRALDFAAFFAPRRPDLASLKRDQAEQFGRCHVLAVRAAWPALADALDRVAETEAAIASALVR